MKNIKRLFKTSLLALGLLFSSNIDAQTISTHFFGLNAWMPDTIGNAAACPEAPCVFNGKLHKQWGKIKSSGCAMIRFGGIAPDRNRPTNFQYIKMIDSVRAKGMEPIIQVPFYNNRYTAQQAADIVQYINVTKGKNIKYWVIGNEPNLDYGYTTAAQVAAYIRPFSSAMKSVDPSILIIGPELAWFHESIINGLTTPNGNDDITGKDGAGRYYIDIFSFHTYPFNGSQTRDEVISKLTASGSLHDDLVYLNNRINACNTAHNRTGANKIKTAITEANIDYQNSSSDNLNGVGANSFIGGQFVAEMMGIALKNNVDFINLWSVIEGNNTASNIGLIDPSTGNKKPLYYHFQMMAQNFHGNMVTATDNQPKVKTFASHDAQQTTVMIMNQDLTTNFNYTVSLSTAAISGSSGLKINVSAGISNEYSEVVPSQSTVLLVFNASGAIVKKIEYSLTGHATSNLAPTVMEFITTGDSDVKKERDDFEIKVYPNPAIGKFTIQLDKQNYEERVFQVELINMLGQLVYRKKSNFLNGKDLMELNETVAAGGYVVRVKEGEVVRTTKMIIIK